MASIAYSTDALLRDLAPAWMETSFSLKYASLRTSATRSISKKGLVVLVGTTPAPRAGCIGETVIILMVVRLGLDCVAL